MTARCSRTCDADEVIVVDDASARPVPGALRTRRARRRGGRPQRRPARRAQRDRRAARQRHASRSRAGWSRLLAHFNDPMVDIVAPRIVPLRRPRLRSAALAARPRAGRGAGGALRARAVRARRGAARPEPRALRRDAHARGRGRRAGVAHAVRALRAEPRTSPTRTAPSRAPGSPAASTTARRPRAIARRHPGKARPLHVSPWTTAAWAAALAGRPNDGAAGSRRRRPRCWRARPALRTAAELAALGTLQSGRVVADALTRHWWPLALAHPRTRARVPDQAAAARSSTTSPTAPACGSAASSTARSTHFCPPEPGSSFDALCKTAPPMKKWVVIAAWLIAAAIAFPFQSKLQVLASDESDAFKDNGAESTPGRRDHRAALRGGRRDHRGGRLHPPGPAAHARGRAEVLREAAGPGRRPRDHARSRASAASCRRSRCRSRA